MGAFQIAFETTLQVALSYREAALVLEVAGAVPQLHTHRLPGLRYQLRLVTIRVNHNNIVYQYRSSGHVTHNLIVLYLILPAHCNTHLVIQCRGQSEWPAAVSLAVCIPMRLSISCILSPAVGSYSVTSVSASILHIVV